MSSNFLYQRAVESARYARRVFNGYFKKSAPKQKGEAIEPHAKIHIELGYMRRWKDGDNDRKEFHTSTHLNKALEAYVAKRLEDIANELVTELETKARDMTIKSRDMIAAELDMIDALAASLQEQEPADESAA